MCLLAVSCVRAQEKVTYDGQVLPVFQQACLNCHNADKAKGGLDLSSYAATLKGGSGGAIVEAGDAGSRLVRIVEHAQEPRMPPEGDKLPAAQVAVIKRWIEGGLLENPGSGAKKPTRPKVDLAPKSSSAGRPDGPPPMPADVLLEPVVATSKGSSVRALAVSPWAPLLAVSSQRQVLLFDSGSLELVGVLPFPEGDPLSLSFFPDGRHLVVAGGVPGKSGTSVVFDVVRGTRVFGVGREFDSILAADSRSGMDLVVTGGTSRLLKFWDVSSGEMRKSIKKHTDWVTSLDVSPDGVLVASGDRNGGVWVWESGTGNEFHTLRAHQAAISSVLFRGDSNLLATASEDGTVRFWEMNGGAEVRKIDAHPGGVTAFSFARDGSFLTAGRDLKVRLWKPDFNPVRELCAKLPELPVSAVLDAEGKRAFVGLADGRILAIGATDGKQAGILANNQPSLQMRIRELDGSLAELGKQSAADEGVRKRMESMARERQRWVAAEINARAIVAREAAALLESKAVEARDAFKEAALEVARRNATLCRKRAERAELESCLGVSGVSNGAREEIRITLGAVDAVLARELENHKQGEELLIRQSHDADMRAEESIREAAAARALGQAYREALPKGL